MRASGIKERASGERAGDLSRSGGVRRRVVAMASDPGKICRQDAGQPNRCEVYDYHREWNAAEAPSIGLACGRGMLGCRDCRERLIRVGSLRRE